MKASVVSIVLKFIYGTNRIIVCGKKNYIKLRKGKVSISSNFSLYL